MMPVNSFDRIPSQTAFVQCRISSYAYIYYHTPHTMQDM